MGINAFRASLGEVLPTQGLCNSQGSLTPPKWAWVGFLWYLGIVWPLHFPPSLMHRAASCQRPYSLQSCLSLMYHIVHSSFDLISNRLIYTEKKKKACGYNWRNAMLFCVSIDVYFFHLIWYKGGNCFGMFFWFGEFFILNPWVMLHCSSTFARLL